MPQDGTVSPSLLARLVAAGTPADLVGEVALLIAKSQLLEERKANDRERKERQRNGPMSRDVTGQPGQDVTSSSRAGARAEPKITNSSVPIPERKKESKNIGGLPPTHPPTHFDRFWSAYPKRAGNNPKHPAYLKFLSAVKAGVDPEAIIAAAGRYAEAEEVLGHTRTEFVQQAVTWLNQRGWESYPVVEAEPTGPPLGPSRPTADELRAKYTRMIEEEKRHDSQAKANLDAEASDDHAPRGGVLPQGAGLHRETEAGQAADLLPATSRNQAGQPGVAGVGSLFPDRVRRGAGGDENGSRRPRPVDDDADAVARALRH